MNLHSANTNTEHVSKKLKRHQIIAIQRSPVETLRNKKPQLAIFYAKKRKALQNKAFAIWLIKVILVNEFSDLGRSYPHL